MSDGIILKDTVNESADTASFWCGIFVGCQGIRSGWRLTLFLLILAGSIFGLLVIGILRIPATARIFHQGFLSPSLEYLIEIPTAICLLVCSLVMGESRSEVCATTGCPLVAELASISRGECSGDSVCSPA